MNVAVFVRRIVTPFLSVKNAINADNQLAHVAKDLLVSMACAFIGAIVRHVRKFFGILTCFFSATSATSTTLSTEKSESSTPSSTRTTAAGRHSGQVGSSTTLSGRQTTSVATEEPPMDLCRGAWNWPAGCQATKCLYSLQWRFEEQTVS